MSREPFSIRPATRRDLPDVIALVRKLAEFEKLAPPDAAALRRYAKHGFGRKRYFRILVAEEGRGRARAMLGYAFYFFTYSTFEAKPTLYLEDLFVLPEQRRRGVGAALLRTLARIAKRENCGRMEWMVLDWNVKAMRFYRGLGAKELREWRLFRVRGKGISAIAAKSD